MKTKTVFKYTKNKIEKTPYICTTTKKPVNILYTTSNYIHEFSHIKEVLAERLLYRVLESYVEPSIPSRTSFADVYHKEIATAIVETFYYKDACTRGFYSICQEKSDDIDKLMGSFSYDSTIQTDFEAVYILYKDGKDIKDSHCYVYLIESIIKSIYIRGYMD